MRPRTKSEMDEVIRTLVRDCVALLDQTNLRQVDLSKLIGVSRPTIGRWVQHLQGGGDWQELPVGGTTSAIIFMNLMIVRRLLEDGLEDGTFPLPEANITRLARQWVKDHLPDPTR